MMLRKDNACKLEKITILCSQHGQVFLKEFVKICFGIDFEKECHRSPFGKTYETGRAREGKAVLSYISTGICNKIEMRKALIIS